MAGRKLIPFLLLFSILTSACKRSSEAFVHVENGQFVSSANAEYFIGTNFWYGPILASEGRGGDRERLHAELDALKNLGVTNLRILVGADGPEGIATRVEPTLQPSPLVYNDTLLRGLDYLLDQMAAREMKAVLYINNAWEWSGGYGMYLEWAGAGKAPIPAEIGYPAYTEAVSAFVTNEEAKRLFASHLRNIVSRTNSITGKPYRDDPTIFSWQICNEPRCFSDDPKVREQFVQWLRESAAQIKSLDSNHLVSTGSEGSFGCEQDIELFERIHSCPDIDYFTIHIWPYNWSWAHADKLLGDLDTAIARSGRYIDEHLAVAQKYGKPVVIEEFGYPRDGFISKKSSSTTARDAYYKYIFGRVAESAGQNGLLAGANFWAWGGFAGQAEGHDDWRRGDEYCGDPAQEAQGLNSVYMGDSTIEVVREGVQAVNAAAPRAWIDVETGSGIFRSGEERKVCCGIVCSNALTEALREGRAQATLELSDGLGRERTLEACEISFRDERSATAEFFPTKMEPGFYRASLVVREGGRSSVLCSGNIGFDPESIVSPQSKMEDFDSFWEATLTELAQVDPQYRFTKLEEYSDEVRDVWRVDMKSFGGADISGVLVEPAKEGNYPAFVSYMGYGSSVWYPSKGGSQDRVEFLLCIRNQALNRAEGEKDDWCTRGLESKETYYYRGAFADAVRAVDMICSRPKTDTSRVYAHGESQGGALTLVAASLDRRIKGIAPSAPFLNDFEDYFELASWPADPIIAQAESLGISREELMKTLSYFDVKNFTDRIECPVLMAIGLQDPVCPPHTNFAGYNMIESEKRWICYPHSEHNVWQQKGWPEEKEKFFRTLYQ